MCERKVHSPKMIIDDLNLDSVVALPFDIRVLLLGWGLETDVSVDTSSNVWVASFLIEASLHLVTLSTRYKSDLNVFSSVPIAY